MEHRGSTPRNSTKVRWPSGKAPLLQGGYRGFDSLSDHALISQSVEETDLKSAKCGFESHWEHAVGRQMGKALPPVLQSRYMNCSAKQSIKRGQYALMAELVDALR